MGSAVIDADADEPIAAVIADIAPQYRLAVGHAGRRDRGHGRSNCRRRRYFELDPGELRRVAVARLGTDISGKLDGQVSVTTLGDVVCLGLWMTMRNSTKNTEAVGAIVAKPKSESQVWQIRLQKQTT